MNPKIKKALQDPYYACSLLLNRVGRFVSDENFVKWTYYLTFRKKLDLDNPKTFNEKLQWLKLNDQHEEYTQMVDKYEAKKYVSNLIGEEYIIPTLGVYDSFDEIDFDKLPNQFVLKCTHDSGGVAICKDKYSFDVKAARKLLSRNLKRNKYWSSREYPYKTIKPRIIAEKYIEESAGGLVDYKFFCFNGYADSVMLCIDRHLEDTKYYFFDNNWNLLRINCRGKSAPKGFTVPKQDNMDKMFSIAAQLSRGIKFVRVDLYNVNGRIYFGEMTFFPQSGLDPNLLIEAETRFGNLINV
ncbi:MAG: glycosyl transferase [Prevotella sp.]|nr:glycosyl transferase [Prevotella sp.]